MTLPFAEHLDLLDVHGREVVAGLGQASPGDRMPPLGETAQQMAEDHWSTLEIWAWSLENPTSDWRTRKDRKPPKHYDALVAGISTETRRSVKALASAGPDATIDYFGRPGTVAEVARLLAHEAITKAHSASLVTGRPTPLLPPLAAADGIDQTLHDWACSDTDVAWGQRTVVVRTTDTDDAWYLSLSREADVEESRFRLVAPAEPSVVVEASAAQVLWWLHGHTSSEVSISGDDMMRALHAIFMHAVEDAPKRRRWWWFS
ncbi:MAG: hypothetical protein Q4P15_05320 [Propionibacteriaceae bacterium]|nr:hypothetical protein [Propionibacteriaceae bacterium]